jgi:hypothetical protein
MSQVFLAPIVGMHFRPPASLLLANCPLGTPLQLRFQPDNPYDPGAIQVLLDSRRSALVRDDDLDRLLGNKGTSWEEVMEQPEGFLFHVGFLAANPPKGFAMQGYQLNKAIGEALSQDGGPYMKPHSCILQNALSGDPTAKITLE